MSAVSDLSEPLIQQFHRDGYLKLRGAIPAQLCSEVATVVASHLSPLVGPVEYEADLGYPGAPGTRSEQGGQTPRRLLHAYARHSCFGELAGHSLVVEYLSSLMQAPVVLSQSHHNCVMTKHPGYSSATAWHQDIRYWSFDRPELITAWFALGPELRQNGALRVIPGTHALDFDRGALDRDLFLRPELPENKQLIRQAVDVDLEAGDVLLFHCRLFHAAGKNRSAEVKLSPVFTYHAAHNQPIPGTRSAALPGIPMSAGV